MLDASPPTRRSWAARLRRPLPLLVLAGTVAIVAGLAVSWVVGDRLTAPALRPIGPPTAAYPAEEVAIASGHETQLAGWYSEAPGAAATARGSVLLLHGVRGDRTNMVARARFLRAAGYHTLCLDLQAHGESPGERITMGRLESQDAAAGVAWLRARHSELPVAVIGTSLGGAAATLADYETPPDALVLESVFADLHTAILNRLRVHLGPAAPLVAPLLELQMPYRLGVGVEALRPVDAIAHYPGPVLLAYGDADHHATLAEARAMETAAGGSATLWTLPGAAHVDLHAFAPADYETRVLDFLAASLPVPAPVAE